MARIQFKAQKALSRRVRAGLSARFKRKMQWARGWPYYRAQDTRSLPSTRKPHNIARSA